MTAKSKSVIAAMVVLIVAISAYYFLQSSGETAPSAQSSLQSAPGQKLAANAMPPNAAVSVVALVTPTKIVTPVVVAAVNTAGPEVDAAALAAFRKSLTGYKRSADLQKLDAPMLAYVQAWAERDASAVITWLGEIPEDDKQREHAFEAMSAMEFDKHPSVAIALANAISDPVVRDNRVTDVLMAMVLNDATSAAAAMNAVNLSEDARAQITSLIELVKYGKLTDDQRARLLQKVNKDK